MGPAPKDQTKNKKCLDVHLRTHKKKKKTKKKKKKRKKKTKKQKKKRKDTPGITEYRPPDSLAEDTVSEI